jgi:hypothetical protein
MAMRLDEDGYTHWPLVRFVRPEDQRYDDPTDLRVAAVPRKGERVLMLPSAIHSYPELFHVSEVEWYVDHTKFDACVYLERKE